MCNAFLREHMTRRYPETLAARNVDDWVRLRARVKRSDGDGMRRRKRADN
jgi:hypothetical protein